MIGIHPLHLHRIRFTEISEIYTSETIKNLAFSLVGLFIPIYLLNNGVSLTQLCFFFVLQSLFRFLIEPAVGRGIARFGAKHVLSFSYPISFAFITLLVLYPMYQVPLWVIAVIWAVADSMHWVSYHAAFSRAKHKKKAGREIGLLNILAVLAGAVGPILAGFIAVNSNLNFVFVIAAVLLLVAMVPLFQTLESVRSKKLVYKGLTGRIKRDLTAHAAINFEVVVASVIWPLFIYFIVKDYLQLGAIVSLSLLLSIVIIFITGRMTDNLNKKALIVIGSTSMAAVNIFRSLANSFWYASGVNIAATVVAPLLQIPLVSIFYAHADTQRRIEYVVLMEMAADLSRTVFWILLFVLSVLVSQQELFTYSFVLASAALLFTNVVRLRLKP